MSFSACSDDDDSKGGGGAPVVRYVRPCDVTISDSLLSSGYLGDKVALIGEHLAGVNKIYFNDQKVKLNPNFITDNAIILNIPSGIPGEKQDLIKLYTDNDSCYYTFETLVPAPAPNSMTCEYVEAGDIAYIQGLYFIHEDANPLTVTFPGNGKEGIKGEIVSYDVNNIAVKVPAGAQSGPLKVTSVYGTTESPFHFRDNRNIILDFDHNYPDGDHKHGWHGGKGVSDEGGINGKYLILSGAIAGADGKVADADFCYDRWTYRPDDPDFVDAGALDKYVLKFEVSVQAWSAGAFQVIFTGKDEVLMNWQDNPPEHNPNEDAKWDKAYPRILWTPWTATGSFETGWITVTIPMSDCKYGVEGAAAAPKGAGHYSGLTVFVGSGGVKGVDCTSTFHIDNVRVVPAK
jgi:hypothetical protein